MGFRESGGGRGQASARTVVFSAPTMGGASRQFGMPEASSAMG